MNEDMSEFLGVFLDEAQEQLELMEQDFLVLEQEASPDLLQRIFRAAHTLKGSSRTMGFDPMGELTHAMEDVLDKLRQNAIGISRELIDSLFDGLDALKVMKEEIADTSTTLYNTECQTQRLRAVLGGPPPPSLKETSTRGGITEKALDDNQRTVLREAMQSGFDIRSVVIQVAPNCLMKSVRALMALQALERVGSILALSPSEEDIENERFDVAIEALIATEQENSVLESAVLSVSEVVGVTISLWGEQEEEKANNTEILSPTASSLSQPNLELSELEDATALASSPLDTPEAKKAPKQAQTVRVDVARLDKLLNLVGELVIDRTRITQLGLRFEQAYSYNELTESLRETAAHVGRITDELQEEIMKARMLPIDNVFNRFPRMIRDLAQNLDKEINFVIEGRETELDRSVIEVLSDPLTHMLRNSIDHGVETPQEREAAGKPRIGHVWLRARHEESHIVIEIEDDGRGMDAEKLRAKAVQNGMMSAEIAKHLSDKEALQLIFASGFSTAKAVTDVSGRGVGMDIVRSNFEKLGAAVEIESVKGKGSRFTVKLPLTLAIIRALLITVRGCVYALPLGSVLETLKIAQESIHTINHQEAILQRGKTLPVLRMRSLFAFTNETTPAERALAQGGPLEQEKAEAEFLVVVGAGEKRYGLLVDTLIGEQEVVIKALGRFIGDIKGISGATILGDGRVALIVDVNGLVKYASERARSTR